MPQRIPVAIFPYSRVVAGGLACLRVPVIPSFSDSQLEAVAKQLGDALTGTEIGRMLQQAEIYKDVAVAIPSGGGWSSPSRRSSVPTAMAPTVATVQHA